MDLGLKMLQVPPATHFQHSWSARSTSDPLSGHWQLSWFSFRALGNDFLWSLCIFHLCCLYLPLFSCLSEAFLKSASLRHWEKDYFICIRWLNACLFFFKYINNSEAKKHKETGNGEKKLYSSLTGVGREWGSVVIKQLFLRIQFSRSIGPRSILRWPPSFIQLAIIGLYRTETAATLRRPRSCKCSSGSGEPPSKRLQPHTQASLRRSTSERVWLPFKSSNDLFFKHRNVF